FTREDGRGWHPAQVTYWFQRIARSAGLPPVSLHGLRHGAASMSLAAGVDVQVVSAELGHATTHLPQDTSQTVSPDVAKAAAAAPGAMLKPAVDRAVRKPSSSSAWIGPCPRSGGAASWAGRGSRSDDTNEPTRAGKDEGRSSAWRRRCPGRLLQGSR